MSESECTQCRHRNATNVGIGMLDNWNALEKCWHRNELKWRHRNALDVSIGMHPMSESEWTMMASDWWTIRLNSDVGIGMDPLSASECWTIGMNMSGQKTACQNNLRQKRTTCGKKLLVRSEQFSGQDGTLCRNTFHRNILFPASRVHFPFQDFPINTFTGKEKVRLSFQTTSCKSGDAIMQLVNGRS
jgi:hypothetical protein